MQVLTEYNEDHKAKRLNLEKVELNVYVFIFYLYKYMNTSELMLCSGKYSEPLIQKSLLKSPTNSQDDLKQAPSSLLQLQYRIIIHTLQIVVRTQGWPKGNYCLLFKNTESSAVVGNAGTRRICSKCS